MAQHELADVLQMCLEDPAFRREWEQTAVARAVALWLMDYRERECLSLQELAKRLSLRPSVVATLEAGDTEPKLSMLLYISRTLQQPLALQLESQSASDSLGQITIDLCHAPS